MLIVPSEINEAIKHSGIAGDIVPEWTVQWNPTFGEFSSDIATVVAAKTKGSREAIADQIVAVCPHSSSYQVKSHNGYLNLHTTSSEQISRWLVPSTIDRYQILLTPPTKSISGLGYLRLTALAYIHWRLACSLNPSATLAIINGPIIGAGNKTKEFLDAVQSYFDDAPHVSLSKDALSSYDGPLTAWISSVDIRGGFQDGFATDLFRNQKVFVRSPSKSFLSTKSCSTEWKDSLNMFPNETLAYLGFRDEPTDELESVIPRIQEGANVWWNAQFLIQRLERVLSNEHIDVLGLSTVDANPHVTEKVNVCFRTMLLWDAMLYRVAQVGEVVNWSYTLRNLIEATHGILNDPKLRGSVAQGGFPKELAVLLSSVKVRLGAIMSALKV